MIYFNGDINKIQYNGHTIRKVYSCGGNLVWSSVTPPTGNKLTYTVSGNTYYIPCNESSTLTKLEILESVYDEVGMIAKLDSAVIGNCVTVINSSCFNEETNLTSVTIPNSVTTIKDDAFYHCTSLSSITIPSSVTIIEDGAFDSVSLSTITIPDSITTIPLDGFKNCIYLNTIDIPSGVTSIGEYAFFFDEYMEEPEKTIARTLASNRVVTIHCITPPTLGIGVFDWSGLPNLCTYPIYVPAESVNAYKTAWPQYTSRIQAIP